ncbi:unnamed protein product [marine sediment metagenome]|uniref:HhH-GPD domain-containing protein n=1 Tax=marine sediment metagenome TaxID=412755 RepID=X0YLI4_9ZZZZ
MDKIVKIITILCKATKDMPRTLSQVIAKKYDRDPFLLLMSCLLSLRAKDVTTIPIAIELFKLATTPREILAIPITKLEKIIHTIGFYRKKAKLLHSVSREILDRFNGIVPDSSEELLSINGVGIKTANLVLSEGFGIPAICVDTHVHTISNRLGLVVTKKPEDTEKALMAIFPKKYWSELNNLFVLWGQNICTPVSPFCSKCAIAKLCKRVGVAKSR